MMADAKKLPIIDHINMLHKAVSHLLPHQWKIDSTMNKDIYLDDLDVTERYIDAVFRARESPNGEKIQFNLAAVDHLLLPIQTRIGRAPSDLPGPADTTESHIRHVSCTDGACISKKTKVALNATMYLLENICIIDPPKTCMGDL